MVRSSLKIDPITAQVTVTTDPSGPYAIPHILKGIPIRLHDIRVYIDRPRFTLNPTNCTPMSITGTITGNQGTTATVKVPFQVTNCASLKFKPKFTVSTSAKTSRVNRTL